MTLKRGRSPTTPNKSSTSKAQPGAPTKRGRRTRRTTGIGVARQLFEINPSSPNRVNKFPNKEQNGGKKHKINRKTRKARKTGKNKK